MTIDQITDENVNDATTKLAASLDNEIESIESA